MAHLSGASGLDVLSPARAAGARPLALHPLQTFPDVAGALDRIPGCAMAVTADDDEGYTVGERIADDLMALPFRLDDELRPLYHAAAVFASNYLIVTSGIAEDLFRRAGVPDPLSAMLPLQRASLDNVERLGPAEALTGPAVRGDADTIERNLAALRSRRGPTLSPRTWCSAASRSSWRRAGRLPRGSARGGRRGARPMELIRTAADLRRRPIDGADPPVRRRRSCRRWGRCTMVTRR